MSEDIIKKAVDSGIAPFAVTTYRNKEKIFGIKKDDRRRHVYIIGKTGMGKTTLIENMVYSDIIAGHGVCYIDPHGDTAEKMLGWIPSWRVNDVVYFNPADLEFPISFNVLEKVDPKYRHLVSSGLVGVFKKLWAESWGPRLEYILRNAILALLEYPDSTLLGINRLLVDKEYRKKVVEKIQDPVVRSFWVDEFPKWNERVLQEVVSPIQNKVGQFLSTALIRNVVGQVKSSVNLRDLMDTKKILILNLSKGRIGEDASALMGAMMVTKIQLAAMSRVDIPEEERNDYYLYVDEFQNFITDSFANILSEARKYHLNLTIAHQYIEQLGEVVQPAVFGNVGTIIVFRIGAADAEFLETEFAPSLTPEDLVNLPKYHVYLKLMIEGVTSEPFSARGLRPVYSASMGNEEKVIRASRERYTKTREVVEDKIYRWSLGDKEAEKKDAAAAQKKGIVVDVFAKRDDQRRDSRRDDSRPGNRDDFRSQAPKAQPMDSKQPQAQVSSVKPVKVATTKPMYPAKCDNCGRDVELPFLPDKSRPVFCKDCLKKSRRGEIKIQPVKAAAETIETKVEELPAVSLDQLNKQTVDFKGRAVKEVRKEASVSSASVKNLTNEKTTESKKPSKDEISSVDPLKVKEQQTQQEFEAGKKNEEVKEQRPHIEPPPIRQPQSQKIDTVIETKEKVKEASKEAANPMADSEGILGEQEIPVIEKTPQPKLGSVDFMKDFESKQQKDIKEGEEIEL